MYLYQAFNLRMQLISIFQRQSRIYRELVLARVQAVTSNSYVFLNSP